MRLLPRALERRAGLTTVLSTYLDGEGEPVGREVRLRPDEGAVIRLQATS